MCKINLNQYLSLTSIDQNLILSKAFNFKFKNLNIKSP